MSLACLNLDNIFTLASCRVAWGLLLYPICWGHPLSLYSSQTQTPSICLHFTLKDFTQIVPFFCFSLIFPLCGNLLNQSSPSLKVISHLYPLYPPGDKLQISREIQ